jgi:hypothetical protein
MQEVVSAIFIPDPSIVVSGIAPQNIDNNNRIRITWKREPTNSRRS